MIAVSTLAFLEKTIEEIITTAQRHGWMLEFTSSFPYREDIVEIYRHSSIPKLPHNYFPPPQIPFVLNLASTNKQIREQSIVHCIQGVILADEGQSPFYAAHAGFCIDPHYRELGKKFSSAHPFHREEHWELLLDSVRKILVETQHLTTPFLIENNVLAPFNLTNDDENPLLCSDPEEMISLVEAINNRRFGLLLDTAHLKVSGHTLGYDYYEAVETLQSVIRGIHHSDNNGDADTNDLLQKDYWFAPFMPSFRHTLHVIEVKGCTVNEIVRMIHLLEKWQYE